MTWVATAVGGSAVLGMYTSGKAADQQASASKAGLKQSNALAGQSRQNAVQLYNQGLKARQAGDQGAFNFYQQNANRRINPYVGGNVAAQQAIGLGAQQANNALLGLPTDMSFQNPQQIQYSGLSAGRLPQASQGFELPADQLASPAPAKSGGGSGGLGGLLGSGIGGVGAKLIKGLF